MQLVNLIIMNNKSKLKLAKYINQFTTFFCVYSMIIISFPVPMNLNAKKHLNNQEYNYFQYTNTLKKNLKQNLYDLENKVYSDLNLHDILNKNKPKYLTQLTITKDGKIIGYKPTNLRCLNHILEKQVSNMLNKDSVLIHQDSNIYWLNLV